MAEITCKNLHKSFGDFVAVRDADFTVDDGELFVMLGPSGCGKTTTLRMIAGLELPTAGEILLDGEDVTYNRAAHRDIAFVFQLFALYPHMNVRKNIAFPLVSQGVPRQDIKTRVEETARLLRIDHLLNKSVSGLSGGDRQRVALGRAIVRRPKAFLMDEPLGALDAEFRELMCGELRGLHDRMNATTVYVTHDQLEAMSLADRIMVMNHGVIEQMGTPQEIYDRPVSMFVADFIGSPSMGFLNFTSAIKPGQTELQLNGAAIAVPTLTEGRPESALALGVRPEHITLSDDAPLRAEVYGVEYLGTTQVLTLNTAFGQLHARVPAALKVHAGETAGLSFHADKLVVFDAESGRSLDSRLFSEPAHG